MSEFFSEALTIKWLISVVVVGIAINLISAYLKAPLDHFLDHRSKRQKVRIDKEQAELEEKAAIAASDTTLLLLEGQKSIIMAIIIATFMIMILATLCFGIFIHVSGTSQNIKSNVNISVLACTIPLMVLNIYFMNKETKHAILLERAKEIYKSSKA